MPPELICNLKEDNLLSPTKVLATASGRIIYLRNDQIIWSQDFGHQLFGLSSLDANLDGSEEIIVSTWSSQVIIGFAINL